MGRGFPSLYTLKHNIFFFFHYTEIIQMYYSSLSIVKLTLILFSYACFLPAVQGLNHRGKGTKFSVIKQVHRSLQENVDEAIVEPEGNEPNSDKEPPTPKSEKEPPKETKETKEPKKTKEPKEDPQGQGYSVDISELVDSEEATEQVANSMTSINSASINSSRNIVMISAFVSIVAFHCVF